MCLFCFAQGSVSNLEKNIQSEEGVICVSVCHISCAECCVLSVMCCVLLFRFLCLLLTMKLIHVPHGTIEVWDNTLQFTELICLLHVFYLHSSSVYICQPLFSHLPLTTEARSEGCCMHATVFDSFFQSDKSLLYVLSLTDHTLTVFVKKTWETTVLPQQLWQTL